MRFWHRFKSLLRQSFEGPLTLKMAMDITNGIQTTAWEIDPRAPIPMFSHNGIQYCVLDAYCLNPDCDCSDVGLHFAPMRPGADTGAGDTVNNEVAFFHYDYRSGKRSTEKSKAPRKRCNQLWDAFIEQCGDMPAAYEVRHRKYRQLAAKWLPRTMRRLEKMTSRSVRRTERGSDEHDTHPSLQAVLDESGMNIEDVSVAFPFSNGKGLGIKDRHEIVLDDGRNSRTWHVDSLSAFFRGNAEPPSFSDMNYYPEKYERFFSDIESHVVTLANLDPPPTDHLFNEVYAAMRRRPDGRSLGPVHDAVWQATCLALALHPWSAMEYEAVFRQLARSARAFRMGVSSRHYMTYLQSEFRDEPAPID